jgi:potassium/hydrogen antiporter
VLGAIALRRVALPASGLYPIAVLALIVAAYEAASLAHSSGFLAVYLAAVVLGNARLPHGPATRSFAEGLARPDRVACYARPARIPGPAVRGGAAGLVAGTVFVLIARPAVLACTLVGVFTLAQGPTLPWAVRRLRVIAPAEPLALDVEAAPLEALHALTCSRRISPQVPGCPAWRSSNLGVPTEMRSGFLRRA